MSGGAWSVVFLPVVPPATLTATQIHVKSAVPAPERYGIEDSRRQHEA